MSYLALDLGLRLGWAIWRSDGRVQHGVKKLDEGGARDAQRFFALRLFLQDTHAKLKIEGDPLEGIVFESVDFRVSSNGVYAEHVYGAIWGGVLAWAEGKGLPVRGINVSTIKRHVVGLPTAAKPLVTKAMKERFPLCRDPNEADALAVLLTAQNKFGAEA